MREVARDKVITMQLNPGVRENLPLSACPDECNRRGTCAHEWGGTTCFCFRGYEVTPLQLPIRQALALA